MSLDITLLKPFALLGEFESQHVFASNDKCHK